MILFYKKHILLIVLTTIARY